MELTFSFLLVLGLLLHAVYYAKNETVNMFLDVRPFDYVFQFRRPTRLKEGPILQYVCIEEFIFSSERPKINSSRYKKKCGGCGRVGELPELFTVLPWFYCTFKTTRNDD